MKSQILILEDIVDERARQDEKWRDQSHHSLTEWMIILMEEIGELAAAILCHKFGKEDHPELNWQKEAIQAAAVLVAMLEYKGDGRDEP